MRLRSFYGLPTQEEWRRCLHQAADILEHRGWCRSTLERGERHCAVGAILAAYNEGDVRYKGLGSSILLQTPAVKWMVGKVNSCLGLGMGSKESSVMVWNDSIAENGKEVAALLRAAARN